jgi:hypothetical protein
MDQQVTRVGCKRDARKALKGDLVEIGSGAYRRTYRDAACKVAYKVCHEPSRDHANRDEHEVVQRCRATSLGREFVAPTTLWVVDGIAVVAQPMMAVMARQAEREASDHTGYMSEDDFYMAEDEIEEVAEELGVSDMHYGNWGFDQDKHAWIIDANIAWM